MKTRTTATFTAQLLACVMLCLMTLSATAQPTERIRRYVDASVVKLVQSMSQGDVNGALQILDTMEKLDPDNDVAKYYRSLIAAGRNDMPRALAYMEAAVRADSTNMRYLEALADMYISSNMGALAKSAYIKLLGQTPYNFEAMLHLASIHMFEGDLDKADSLVNRVEQYRGTSPYTELMHIDILRRRPADQDEFYRRLGDFAIDFAGDSKQKVEIVKRSLDGMPSEKIRSNKHSFMNMLAKIVDTAPTDTTLTHFAGLYYTIFAEPERVDDMLVHNSTDKELWEMSAYGYILRGDDRKYIERAEVLLTLETKDKARISQLHSGISQSYFNLGDMDKAIKSAETALKYSPDNPGLMNNVAYYLALAGRNLERCERLSRKTVEAEPQNATYLDTYAYILYRMKKYPEAKTFLKKALLFGGKNNSEVLEHYADVLEAMGDDKLAKVYRKQAAQVRDAK